MHLKLVAYKGGQPRDSFQCAWKLAQLVSSPFMVPVHSDEGSIILFNDEPRHMKKV